ncbi:hypothetical protein B0H15DRAFT_945954 [Mycena belliarum]|uniref:Uncharacterized protein n=1 Tax=Mycena belliarum TaxID=1033014 RepID=A0AAD6UDG3_9AGAR|nr:hypothetical protein B0H15DRAFT_945954 [Mycena belliae]
MPAGRPPLDPKVKQENQQAGRQPYEELTNERRFSEPRDDPSRPPVRVPRSPPLSALPCPLHPPRSTSPAPSDLSHPPPSSSEIPRPSTSRRSTSPPTPSSFDPIRLPSFDAPPPGPRACPPPPPPRPARAALPSPILGPVSPRLPCLNNHVIT